MHADALHAVAIYAGANGLILLGLALHVGRTRQLRGISIGDGGDAEMIRGMRAQANFTEYVPLCLILLALMALIGTPVWLVHLFGLVLTFGRVLHGWHFARAGAPGWMRSVGATLTLLVLLGASVGLLAHGLVGAG